MRAEAHTRVGDRFVLEHLAGSGGMGEVYKAKDEQSGLSVAVKIMRDGSLEDATRFVREAKILSELDHPHIVRHMAHGVMEDGAPWLAMEWLDGEDLSGRLRRGRLTTHEAIGLALAVAEGLALAHARGFVHRDLKPSNLFLVGSRADDVRILDFGIAVAGMSTRMTRTGMLIGTPGYMAPEQARGDQTIDARADVYSLGSVLFECLTGEPLFSGVHVAAMLAKVLFEDAPRLRDKLPGVPVVLDELLARILAKDPADRPEHGQAVATALRSLGKLDDMDVAAKSVPATGLTRSLTIDEKKGIAIIFIAARQSGGTHETGPSRTLQIVEDPQIRAEAERFGGRCESLLDGSIAVLLTRTTLATDLAARAARCALSLRRLVPGRTIGVAEGRADTTDKSLLGPVIDRAATLCGSTKSGVDNAIWLDEVIVGLLDARFDVREEASGFVLQGERELAEGTRTLLGIATPCVGRERDLRNLEELFDDCLEGTARVALVTAPAGVGKSRLGHEFLRTIRERQENPAIWIARGDSLRAGSALGMLAQALRGTCGIWDGEPLDVRRAKVRNRVAERVGATHRKRVTEFLGEIVGTSFPDEDSVSLQVARLDALLMTEQMRMAFIDFISAECSAHPVVILLEDLHWGDRPTIQFLDLALRELHDKPLFLLALSRPEVHDLFPDLWAHRHVFDIQLKEFGRKSIERLIRHVLGEGVSLQTIERLVRLSEGNAFYLEELIRFAAEGRVGEVPDTVVAMVQSRLGTLDESLRRVLRAASIFGEVSWTGGVAALLGDTERTTATGDSLARLVDCEVLSKRRDSRFINDEEYVFRHALLREGAYGMLTEEDRVLGHRLAGEWLEARGEDDALLLADHFEKGGDKARAAHHYQRAVTRADLAGDSMAAVAYGQRGLACTDVPESRAGLLGVICMAYTWRTDLLSAAMPYATELLQIAPRGSIQWIQGKGIALDNDMMSGRVDEFAAGIRELTEIEFALPTAPVLVFALARSVIGLDFLGKVREGNVVMDRLHLIARAAEDRSGIVLLPAHGMPAMRSCYAHENPYTGLRHSLLARDEAAARYDFRFRDMVGILLVSMNRWFLGDSREAERILLGSGLPDEAFGYVSSLRPFILSWMYAERGLFDQACEYATRLVNAGTTRKVLLDEGRGHWVFGEVLRRRGDFAKAESELETAQKMLQMVCALDGPGVLASRAALRHAEGRHAEALAIAEEALDRYAKIGACSQFFRGAFLRLVHVEILESLGRHDDACQFVRQARERILANAQKITDPDIRRQFLENVPENKSTLELANQWCDNAT